MVSLPWPDRRLSPNGRIHWRTMHKVKAAARELAAGLTMEAIPHHIRQSIAHGDEPIRMTVVFYPPDNRRRDHDNMIASMKAAFDGLADGLKVDDNRFRPSFDFQHYDGAGRVEIRFG